MDAILDRARRYLEEHGRASTDDLVPVLLGQASGNHQLAARIIAERLRKHGNVVRQVDGCWVLAAAATSVSQAIDISNGSSSLLLLERPTASNPASFCTLLKDPRHKVRWMGFTGRLFAKKLRFEVQDSEATRYRCPVTARRLRLLLQQFTRGSELWYLGRAEDLRRLSQTLEWSGLQVGRSRVIGDILPLWTVARKLFSLPKAIRPSLLASALNVGDLGDCEDQPEARFRWWADAFAALQSALIAEGIPDRHQLWKWLSERATSVDFSRYAFSPSDLTLIPAQPGTYSFLDRSGQLLYIGKTRNLRRRIQSYFQKKSAPRKAERILLKKMYWLEYHSVGSELEAIVEENRLIRTLDPAFNTQRCVRSPRAGYFAQRPAIALFEVPGQENVLDLWCLRPGCSARCIRLEPSEASRRRVRGRLERLFFKAGRRRQLTVPDTTSRLLASWLQRNRDSANWIDVDKGGAINHIMKQLGAYQRDSQVLSTQRFIYR